MCSKPEWWDVKRELHVVPVKDIPWMVRLNFSYHPRMVEFVKAVPGAKWDPSNKTWLFPGEMVEIARAYAEKHQFKCMGKWNPPHRLFEDLVEPEGIHPHQWKAIRRAVSDVAHLFNDETGLGKGREVIESLKILGASQILVVCPAQARLVWHNPGEGQVGEFRKWWPEALLPVPPLVVQKGKDLAAPPEGTRIVITSYELLDQVVANSEKQMWDAIVFDEIHYLQNPKSQRSQAAKELILDNLRAYRAGMTATIATNRPDTMANPLNLLYPGRYETGFKFAARYMKQVITDAGFTSFELFDEKEDKDEMWRLDELKWRVEQISTRTTKQEVAHLLPAFITKLGWIDPKKRREASIEWASGKFDEGAKKVCLLTHLRDTAQQLAAASYPKGVEVFCITGEDTHEQRAAKLQAARDAKRAIICATLHSVNVAIDMTFVTVVGFAEIYSRPADMIQVLGRFSRLSGKENVEVTIFASEARDDGAEKLLEKIETINKCIKAGQGETGLQTALAALATPGLTDEAFDTLLADIAKSYNPELAVSNGSN